MIGQFLSKRTPETFEKCNELSEKLESIKFMYRNRHVSYQIVFSESELEIITKDIKEQMNTLMEPERTIVQLPEAYRLSSEFLNQNEYEFRDLWKLENIM